MDLPASFSHVRDIGDHLDNDTDTRVVGSLTFSDTGNLFMSFLDRSIVYAWCVEDVWLVLRPNPSFG